MGWLPKKVLTLKPRQVIFLEVAFVLTGLTSSQELDRDERP
jgi:hypothetical protein